MAYVLIKIFIKKLFQIETMCVTNYARKIYSHVHIL